MAAFDVNDPEAVVSPGGVGFDINCGVRLLRTNLFAQDVLPIKANFISLDWIVLPRNRYLMGICVFLNLGTTCSKFI